MNNSIETGLGKILTRLEGVEEDIKEIKTEQKEMRATLLQIHIELEALRPIKKIVFSLTGAVITSLVMAIIGLVISQ